MGQKLHQTNQFNGGMIKDLHPIMTPNTVMTDCLNGTLITYNGNEFALQNDLGNYAFKHGPLTNGFVPVGMKEFGGMLYIISYNPIEDKVEIGTFPSQKTIFSAGTDSDSSVLNPIEPNKKYSSYKELIKNSTLHFLSLEDTFFLNPGDKYLLSIKGDNLSPGMNWEKVNETLNFQYIKPYIITTDKKVYDIEGYVELDIATETINRSKYKTVNWEIPGWLALKFSLNVMSEFNVFSDSSLSNITKNIINDNNGNIERIEYNSSPSNIIKLQTVWDSNIYKDTVIKNIKDNLVFIIHQYQKTKDLIEDLNSTNKEEPLKYKILENLENSIQNYNSLQTIIFTVYEGLNELSADFKYITPALRVGDKYIVYDQFNQEINRNLQKIDLNKFEFGTNLYKYYVNNDSLTLEFNYIGYPGLHLQYQMYRFLDVTDSTTIKSVWKNYQTFEDVNYLGQNIREILFTKSGDSNVNENASFDKEDIYELHIRVVYEDSEGNMQPLKRIVDNSGTKTEEDFEFTSRIIWATEAVNKHYRSNNNYDKLTATHIENGILDLTNIQKDFKFNNGSYTNSIFSFIEGTKSLNSIDNENLIEKLETPDLTWIEEYLGIPFANSEYDKRYSNKAYIYNGYNFILHEGKLTINYLKNQKDEIGRLWRDYKIGKVGSNTMNSLLIDSKKQGHDILISGSSDINSSKEFFNDDNLRINFIYKNAYTLTVASSPNSKMIATSSNTLTDYNTEYLQSKLVLNDKGKPLYGYIRGGLRMHKDHGRKGASFGVLGYGSLTLPYILFQVIGGKVLTRVCNLNEFRSLSNKTEEELKNYLSDTENWEDTTIDSLEAMKVQSGNEKIPFEEATRKSNTWWFLKDDTKGKTNQWVQYASQANKFAYTVFPVMLYNNRDNHRTIKSELFHKNINDYREYWSVYLPGEYPYIFYPKGSPENNTNSSWATAIYTYIIMCWYMRVATSSAVKTLYYPTISLNFQSAPTIISKVINLPCKMSYSYPAKLPDTSENHQLLLDNINNLNRGFKEHHPFTIDTVSDIYVKEDIKLTNVITKFVLNKNENSATALQYKIERPSTQKGKMFLINEYYDNLNSINEYSLTRIIEDWDSSSNKCLYTEKVDNRVGLQSTDNYIPKHAYESSKIIF